MSQLFINRPIFAWVLAIITMLAGIGAITQLPVEQYPDVAPPQVNIRATYPGASAETVAFIVQTGDGVREPLNRRVEITLGN